MAEQKQLRQLYDTLKAKGLKLTPVRKIILGIFYSHKEDLLKSNEILELVRQSKPGTNFSTIYRNLEIFAENGFIEKVYYDGSTQYKLIMGAADHRNHHMICTLCHKTEPLPYCPVKELEESLKKGNGFLPLDHKIEIYGHCKNCQNLLISSGSVSCYT